jgi:energy-converting hydrogenase Eha subunit C
MLGPLASALVSWIAMERQYLRSPAGMTSLLIKGFAAKMVFFAGYATVLLSSGLVQPIPFVISFMAYFISLHAIEAFGLRRLQTANPAATSGAAF